MRTFDVLVVGGGPAGSSCAWKLVRAGLRVALLDARRFPRDKICGGWVTPQGLGALQVDPGAYSEGRVLQPITGFRFSRLGAPATEISFRSPVSYGVRRTEFDHYLLQRSGAELFLGAPLSGLRRRDDGWQADGGLRARVLVGAGGHFCPVARLLGARLGGEPVVGAQEAEVRLQPGEAARCGVAPETPAIFFCRDMKGYGWCFRKGDYLNVGMGRLGGAALAAQAAAFVGFLQSSGSIPPGLPLRLKGHAYLLYGYSRRPLVGDGVLLAGDAAGLAYAQSGEGIRPAVESGLLAADAILNAGPGFRRADLQPYAARLAARLGVPQGAGLGALAGLLPDRVTAGAAGVLLRWPWFLRRVVLERWFLHAGDPELTLS